MKLALREVSRRGEVSRAMLACMMLVSESRWPQHGLLGLLARAVVALVRALLVVTVIGARGCIE